MITLNFCNLLARGKGNYIDKHSLLSTWPTIQSPPDFLLYPLTLIHPCLHSESQITTPAWLLEADCFWLEPLAPGPERPTFYTSLHRWAQIVEKVASKKSKQKILCWLSFACATLSVHLAGLTLPGCCANGIQDREWEQVLIASYVVIKGLGDNFICIRSIPVEL